MPTLKIDNFKGSMTAYITGDINSGLTNVYEQFGSNPFTYPGRLTWSNASTQIDPNGSVITDLIMAGKERVESGILYVYAIGHTGRLYKIQVNNPATFNANYDNPVLLATLTAQSPTFTRGGFIEFFGSTERIYIGHDKGVTRIDFNGANETFVGALGSWTQTVPRPLQQFVGKLYIGNGTNLAEIDSTATVTTYAKLSPGFPDNTQVRDIDVTPDGIYLQTVVAGVALGDITSTSPDVGTASSSRGYIFKWNGTDSGYTSFDTFPSFSVGANILFQNYQYTFGTDEKGTAMFGPLEKRLTLNDVQEPLPNSISSSANIVTFISPLYFDGFLEADMLWFGSLDFEVGLGFWDVFGQFATGTETDIIRVPCQIPVSNFGIGSSSNGYANNVFSDSKIYFSTLETSSAPTTKYKFYKWAPSLSITNPGTPLLNAVYQTQTQLFSRKVTVSEVRVYGEPWATGNSFSIDLIGSAGTPITNGSFTFDADTTLIQGSSAIGKDFLWYNPTIAPTYAIGLRVTNLGTTNNVITKVEIDYDESGK